MPFVREEGLHDKRKERLRRRLSVVQKRAYLVSFFYEVVSDKSAFLHECSGNQIVTKCHSTIKALVSCKVKRNSGLL